MRRPRHTLRGRLTVAAVGVAALALVVLTVTFNVLLDNSLHADLDSRLRGRADAALATVRVTGNDVSTTESAGDAALDSGTWIYAGDRNVERPSAGPALQAAADRMANRPRRFTTTPDGSARLYAQPVTSGTRRVGTVVAALSLDGYDRTTDLARIGSALFAVAMLLAVAGLSWVVTGAALHPVREMTDQAAEWSDRDLDRRFGSGDRPDELGRLAETFDALLDRIAASLRHEQRLSAELSHELRTPLSKILAEADHLLRRPRPADEQQASLEVIRRGAERMTGILETLMAAARSESRSARGRSEIHVVAEQAAQHVRHQAHDRGVRIEVVPGDRIFVGVESEVVERILAPLLDNGWRHARSVVRLEAGCVDGLVSIDVRDDGAGVSGPDTERIFEPGFTSGDEHDGAGLGLSLARRLARAADGEVRVVGQERSGGWFCVELPAG